MMTAVFWTLAAVAVTASHRADPGRTFRALRTARGSFLSLLPKVLAMVGLIGLVLALVPPEALRRLFTLGGPAGYLAVAAIGAVVTMPGPVAFPLVGSLARLGAAPAALATFVTTLTMVGLVSAPVEVSYFGRRFTALRQGLSFAAALGIGLAMGVFL